MKPKLKKKWKDQKGVLGEPHLVIPLSYFKQQIELHNREYVTSNTIGHTHAAHRHKGQRDQCMSIVKEYRFSKEILSDKPLIGDEKIHEKDPPSAESQTMETIGQRLWHVIDGILRPL